MKKPLLVICELRSYEKKWGCRTDMNSNLTSCDANNGNYFSRPSIHTLFSISESLLIKTRKNYTEKGFSLKSRFTNMRADSCLKMRSRILPKQSSSLTAVDHENLNNNYNHISRKKQA